MTNEKAESELLPCPLCHRKSHIDEGLVGVAAGYIECAHCGLSFGSFKAGNNEQRSECIRFWNTRISPPIVNEKKAAKPFPFYVLVEILPDIILPPGSIPISYWQAMVPVKNTNFKDNAPPIVSAGDVQEALDALEVLNGCCFDSPEATSSYEIIKQALLQRAASEGGE